MSPDQALKVSPTVEPGPSELYASAPSKSEHNDVVKGDNKYQHPCYIVYVMFSGLEMTVVHQHCLTKF